MKIPVRLKSNSPSRTYPIIRYAIIGTICLAVTGCVTTPLKTQHQRDRLVESIGYQPSEVALINHCFFEEVQELNAGKKIRGIRGIVAMTDSEICLMNGVMGIAPTRRLLKIPISEIEGVSRSSEQVQIRYQDKLFVMVVFNWSDFRLNHSLTNKIYESLIAANVPHFEMRRYYSWSMLSSSIRLGASGNEQDLPPTNYEGSIQSMRSQQAAKDRKMDILYGR